MIKEWYRGVYRRIVPPKKWLVFGAVGVLVLIVIGQLLYPADKLLPLASVDDVWLGGWSQADAAKVLDERYNSTPIDIYFGESDSPYRTPQPVDVGLVVKNESRIGGMDYPWYLRIVPTSIVWAHAFVKPASSPEYQRDTTALTAYINQQFGQSCSVAPKNASVTVVDNKLAVEKSAPGGTCSLPELTQALSDMQMTITGSSSIRMPVVVRPADIDDADAEGLATIIENAIKSGLSVTAADSQVVIARDTLVSWLDFSTSGGVLDYSFSSDRASSYLNEQFASKVATQPGVTTIATYDFVETSRQTGASGRTLDVVATLASLKDAVLGKLPVAVVQTSATAPTLQYTRAYSPTHVGLSALMQNFAQTHAGTYGVALTELSGQYRRATYNGDTSFTTASTYKLFIAYSTLKRIESGEWKWTDQVQGGRDLTKCFDDMIVVSDNECAHALLDKIGYRPLTNEAKAIGAVNTSFLGSDGIKTTAEDLALLLAELQTGQILQQQANRDILINAMKRNIYRQGIPKGVAGTVADKVGFLDALLHDAGIVYATSGTYVLVIMTNGSSWGNIAELTRQLEALRIQ